MRFRCPRDELHKTIQSLAGVVASKGVHPVYESVEIVAGDDSLTLLATDLEIGMRVVVGPSETLRVEEPGTAVVPAQRLGAIFRELPGGDVTFSWDSERSEATVEAGRARFKLQGQSPDDFPEIPEVDQTNAIGISAGALRAMIRRTAFAAAKERMRFALNGVLVHVSGEEVEVVATDGRRLARDSGSCTNASDVEFEAIVPTKGLQQLDRALGSDDEEVLLAVGNNHFSGHVGGVTLVSRLVEGSFPPYRDVIPADCERKADIPREAFFAALKRAQLVTSRDAQSVRLRFHAEGLTVSARSTDGSAEETLDCDCGDKEESLGFNPAFLLDALGVLPGESIAFEWNGASSPGKITEGNYTYVVMPVSLE